MPEEAQSTAGYRGRIAPSPTGYLHLGHAATFWVASARARSRRGALVLRIEDLDRDRCKAEFTDALLADLRWYGLSWHEGPDVGGAHGPYAQAERLDIYRDAWRKLAASGAIYPCTCTRRDVERALSAPHQGEQEVIYPGCCRPSEALPVKCDQPGTVNWRFRVPEHASVNFSDGCAGPQSFEGGREFGDFIIWRKDDVPAYQFAVVIDDAAMEITEVVRGADLLCSTAQQILIYQALDLRVPAFFHCPLVTDANGRRLAKRSGEHSLRALRESGVDPAALRPVTPGCAVL